MNSLKGQLLIASTRLLDPNFVQAVILMIQHNKDGAMGLVLNRQTEVAVRDAWAQVSESPCVRKDNLYIGGPCEGVLMALHTFASASQVEVFPGLHFATETQHMEWLLQQADTPMRFCVGYAGWSPGQLETEMEGGSWIVTAGTVERIFMPDDAQWPGIKRELAMAAVLPNYNPSIISPDPSRN